MSSSQNSDSEPFISLTKDDIFLMVVSLFFPPVAVYLRQGFWSKDMLINVLLTILLGVPGFLHAVWVIYTTSSLRPAVPVTSSLSRLEEGHGANHIPEHSHEQNKPRPAKNPEAETLLNPHFPLDNKVQS